VVPNGVPTPTYAVYPVTKGAFDDVQVESSKLCRVQVLAG
jgi:hypothetical protein